MNTMKPQKPSEQVHPEKGSNLTKIYAVLSMIAALRTLDRPFGDVSTSIKGTLFADKIPKNPKGTYPGRVEKHSQTHKTSLPDTQAPPALLNSPSDGVLFGHTKRY